MNKDYRNLNISLEIEYLFLIDMTGKCKKHNSFKRGDSWSLETKSDDYCRFTRDIMIQEQYRSYGIGRLAINKMLCIAQEYVSECSLKGTLSSVYPDASKENYGRRENLYKNIGFIIEEGSFHIERIGDLKIKQNIDGIEKVDLVEELYVALQEKRELADKIFNLEKANKYSSETNSGLRSKVNRLWNYLIFSWIIFMAIVYVI